MEIVADVEAIEACLGFHWSQLLTPAAILVSAGVALFVASRNWAETLRLSKKVEKENRKLARERAAVELMLGHHKEQEPNFRALYWLVENGVNFGQLATNVPKGTSGQSWDDAQSPEKLSVEQRQWMAVRNCLNYFEALAIAIDKGAIDADTVREFLGAKLVWYVEKTHPFIAKVRKTPGMGEDSTWRPLENLAVQWDAEIPPD